MGVVRGGGNRMADDNATRLDEARMLIARALELIVEADETLAAAELEQALDTVTRRADELRFSSGPPPRRPSATQ
jgi:hypothetical protein